VIGYVKRILRGIEVNRDTMMLDLIKRVGPGGHFVAETETARLCRSEIWVPELFDRDPFSKWNETGRLSMNERVHSRLRYILENHTPKKLPQDVLEKILVILEREEKRILE
jgi:trimethylamine--corrinoid protein Co-methyltransferase